MRNAAGKNSFRGSSAKIKPALEQSAASGQFEGNPEGMSLRMLKRGRQTGWESQFDLEWSVKVVWVRTLQKRAR